MNIQQLFDVYASQDTKLQNITQIIQNQVDIELNQNSITFFVFHFLDEYDDVGDLNIDHMTGVLHRSSEIDNIVSNKEQSDIELEPLDTISLKGTSLMERVYNSKQINMQVYSLVNQIYKTLLLLKTCQYTPNPALAQIQECLGQLDPHNDLKLHPSVIYYFALNLSHKLDIYGMPPLDNQVVLQLLILRKQLKLIFKDRQFNYVYVNSQFFAKQHKQIQIQNNLKLKEKQNYFTYIGCPKCKQKKCIQYGERQTTLGGDEMSRIVLLCKNPECLHKFKR